MRYPTVSFILPVYNAERHINNSLKSIFSQYYARDKMEVLIVDGGSTDRTLEIVKNFPAKVICNESRDAESGKSLGIVNSSGEILALIDADNELASTEWLIRMVQPLLDDSRIFGVESNWMLRRSDPAINRYCTYLQISDPLARHLSSEPKMRKRRGYLICTVNSDDRVVTGANGFLWKKSVILEVGGYKPKFEEVNFVSKVVENNFRIYARVPTAGTYHYYVCSMRDFINKRIKIGKKFLKRVMKRQNTWVHKRGRKRFLMAVFFCASVIGPALEAVQHYRRNRDVAWFLHPLACFVTVAVYSLLSVVTLVRYESDLGNP